MLILTPCSIDSNPLVASIYIHLINDALYIWPLSWIVQPTSSLHLFLFHVSPGFMLYSIDSTPRPPFYFTSIPTAAFICRLISTHSISARSSQHIPFHCLSDNGLCGLAFTTRSGNLCSISTPVAGNQSRPSVPTESPSKDPTGKYPPMSFLTRHATDSSSAHRNTSINSEENPRLNKENNNNQKGHDFIFHPSWRMEYEMGAEHEQEPVTFRVHSPDGGGRRGKTFSWDDSDDAAENWRDALMM